MQLRKKLYILFEEPQSSRFSFFLNIFIYILIIISILNLMLSTVFEYQKEYKDIFELVNNIIMPLFVMEYLARFYAAGSLQKYQGIKGSIRYLFSFYALIDFLAILPYILMNIGLNSTFVRSLRLLRIFRLFRAKKYTIFIKLMKEIFVNIKEEMIVLGLFTILILLLLSFSIFEIEHAAQPEVFTDMFQTLWWAVATLTTVGYGDMYPITPLGKFITGAISLIGIAFIAIPGGMLASEFISKLTEKKDLIVEKEMDIPKCPQCKSSDFCILKNPKFELDNQKLSLSSLKVCKQCGYSVATSQ